MSDIFLDKLCAHYQHRQVLGPLSLNLPAKQIVVFIGKSGSGKSTLLKRIHQLYQHRINIALIPQELGLVNTLSCYHNVYMGQLERHSSWYNFINLIRPKATDEATIRQLLEEFGLQEKCWQSSGELSGGQQQRIALARALHQQGELLIADEPVSALDPNKTQHAMSSLCRQYSSALIALHDIDLALQYGHRIIGIKDGQVALDQAASDLNRQDLREFY